MANDQLHRISWKAGELKVHGNSRRHLVHVLAEYLMQEDLDIVKIEPVEEKTESEER